MTQSNTCSSNSADSLNCLQASLSIDDGISSSFDFQRALSDCQFPIFPPENKTKKTKKNKKTTTTTKKQTKTTNKQKNKQKQQQQQKKTTTKNKNSNRTIYYISNFPPAEKSYRHFFSPELIVTQKRLYVLV